MIKTERMYFSFHWDFKRWSVSSITLLFYMCSVCLEKLWFQTQLSCVSELLDWGSGMCSLLSDRRKSHKFGWHSASCLCFCVLSLLQILLLLLLMSSLPSTCCWSIFPHLYRWYVFVFVFLVIKVSFASEYFLWPDSCRRIQCCNILH